MVLDEAEKAETRFTAEGSAKIIDFMMSLDSGVIAMNMEVPGVAETSGNVGTIVTDNDTGYCPCMLQKRTQQQERIYD